MRIIVPTKGYGDYLQWLCELIHVDKDDRSYRLLTRELFNVIFRVVIPNDDNRAMDGIALREEYMANNPWNEDEVPNGACRVLEMLIGMARRMDFELNDPSIEGRHMPEYFWEMVKNLGLDYYSDDIWAGHEMHCEANEERIRLVLGRFMNRTYDRSGKGGLFPLRHTLEDQRGVELWYQMSAYINENY